MLSFLKRQFAEFLSEFVKERSAEEIYDLIETPPENVSGDLAFPCFLLAKDLRKAPNVIAGNLVDSGKLKVDSFAMFDRLEAVGGYVNVHVNSAFLAEKLLSKILSEREFFGKGENKKERILIESPGPNTNKPLHLGHVRNLLLGNAVENICRFAGFDAKRVDIVNDRGVHICKSMLAYQKFGNEKNPDKKSDHFVGDRYVKYATELQNHPEMETEIQSMLVAWEKGDTEVKALWKKMNTRALDGHKVTYARYGTTIEKAYLESDHYEKGKSFVDMWLEKNVFEKDDKGNVVCNLEDLHLGKKVVLRSDGTSIYLTQDLALAELRYQDFKMDRMVYVVGNEQKDYFRALFEILKRMEFVFADKLYHLAYGMISLPSGKMKSREGTVVDADNLADEMHIEARQLLEERYPHLSSQELDSRAEKIAMSAIKFFILKYETDKDFVFDLAESLSFEGESGPYLQYVYARICSILRKSELDPKGSDKNIFSLLIQEEEKKLLLKLAEFAEVVEISAESYRPNLVARWCLELAKLFNVYYQKHKILTEDFSLQEARLALADAVRAGLKNGLELLGIEVLEEM